MSVNVVILYHLISILNMNYNKVRNKIIKSIVTAITPLH